VSAEYENWEDIKKVLEDSKVDLLIVSPFVNVEHNKTRIDFLNEEIPELSKRIK
jgi:hypothetical protein